MSAHTPGPWRFSEPTGLRPRWEHVIGMDGRAVCTVAQALPVAFTPDTPEEAEANARLIAAAPAMLKALRRILEEAEAREDTEDRPEGEGVRPNAWMIVASLCREALDSAGVSR